MAKHLTINFNLSGWNTQVIKLYSDEFTPEEVVDLLNSGHIVTTLQEGGELFLIRGDGFRQIGEVISNDSEGEYFDFELKDEWEDKS